MTCAKGGVSMNLPSYVYLILSMASSASMALMLRMLSSSENNRYGMILGNYLTCTVIGFLLLENKSLILSAKPATYLCGLAGGILFVVSLVCMQTSIGKSGAILTSAFSKLGLLVPLCVSIVFFHETPGVIQTFGLALVLMAVWVFSGSRDDTQGVRNFNLPFLLVVLFTNGMADGMAKIYNIYGVRGEDSLYVFFVFLSAAFLTLFLLVREGIRTDKKTSLKDLAAGILVGIPNYFSSVLLLKALDGIPAFIVYPVFSSGTIVIVTLVSLLLFREYLNKRQLAGLAMILVSIVLLNL